MAHLPNGLHAVVPENPELGLKSGVIFALRNRNAELEKSQHNRLHPYYLIYIDTEGEVLVNHTEVKNLLDIIRGSCKNQPKPVLAACKLFNAKTGNGHNMHQYSNLLGDAIRSMIKVKEDRDIDSLFAGTKTSALEDTIQGLDDFELIAFLVVQAINE